MVVVLAAALVCVAPVAVAFAGTVVLDDFESYPLDAGIGPAASGTYASSWSADAQFVHLGTAEEQARWFITADPSFDPDAGQYLVMQGIPVSTPTEHWAAFTYTGTDAITSALLNFDYLVQSNTDLSLYVSESGATSDRVAIPYSFTHRANHGEIVDSTGTIDLLQYLSQGATSFTVIFDGTTAGSSYSHIRIDNFGLSVQAVPLPPAA